MRVLVLVPALVRVRVLVPVLVLEVLLVLALVLVLVLVLAIVRLLATYRPKLVLQLQSASLLKQASNVQARASCFKHIWPEAELGLLRT